MPGMPQSKVLRRRRHELQSIVGRRVHELRKDARLTQQDLAARMESALGEDGGSLTYQKVISKIESGSHTLTLEVLDAVATALGCDAIELIEAAFHPVSPRTAQQITQERYLRFQRLVDAAFTAFAERIEGTTNGDIGRRAAQALSQLAVHSPDDLAGAVGMLEGLVLQRAVERVHKEGIDAIQRSVLPGLTETTAPADVFGEMSPDELLALFAGFNLQLGTFARFAERIESGRRNE